tara:strand:- start:280 stop:453 length:174 start_codon:yes stop_codon:yes gene_type:complete
MNRAERRRLERKKLGSPMSAVEAAHHAAFATSIVEVWERVVELPGQEGITGARVLCH